MGYVTQDNFRLREIGKKIGALSNNFCDGIEKGQKKAAFSGRLSVNEFKLPLLCQVQPRMTKSKSRIGKGIPKSHKRIQPTLPACDVFVAFDFISTV